MSKSNDKQNKTPYGKLGAFAFVLLFVAPQVMIPLAIVVAILYILLTGKKKKPASGSSSQQSYTPESFTPKSYLPKSFDSQQVQKSRPVDDCPTGLFCFHKDKGMHHVRRGKEIDPWDRPDIDIRTYQKNR